MIEVEKEQGQEQIQEQAQEKKIHASRAGKVKRILLRVGLILLETLLILVVALYGVMFVLSKGPSPTARNLFVRSVRETSAVGFLANLFFSEEEITQMTTPQDEEEIRDTDTSLIVFAPADKKEEGQEPQADAWGFIDEDGDGIILDPVQGEGYHGYMMIILDPSRVFLACKPEKFEIRGYTVAEMVKEFDAVAGINAGGFYDPGGHGNGSIPNSLVVQDGKIYYPELGTADGFVGFDKNYILHVGNYTVQDIEDREIQNGVCFGPVLINNGVPRSEDSLSSGINPRSGIGQRSDGAILLLAIEGRMVTSLGATYSDMVEIFQAYGAVNACNLDGGSSTMMWFDGDYINRCASVVGVRRGPTSFLVLKEGVSNDG